MAARSIICNFGKALCYSITRQRVLLFCNHGNALSYSEIWQRVLLNVTTSKRFVTLYPW